MMFVTHNFMMFPMKSLLFHSAEKEKPVVRIETFFQSSNDEHMSQVEDEASRNTKFQFEVIEDVKPWEVTNGTCKTHGSNLSKYVSYKIPESIVKFVMILNCIREGLCPFQQDTRRKVTFPDENNQSKNARLKTLFDWQKPSQRNKFLDMSPTEKPQK